MSLIDRVIAWLIFWIFFKPTPETQEIESPHEEPEEPPLYDKKGRRYLTRKELERMKVELQKSLAREDF